MPSSPVVSSTPWVTWLLIVTGWVVVHYLTLTRERQKEVRDLKMRLVDRILEVERRGCLFHQAAIFSPDEAGALVAEIGRISAEIARLPLSTLRVPKKAVVRFRASITLANFDLTRFQPQPATSLLLSNISLAAEGLINALEHAYDARYLSRWWQAFRI